MDTNEVKEIGECVSIILKANQRVGQALWEITKNYIADKVSRNKDLKAAVSCIENVYEADVVVVEELCGLLDLNAMTITLNRDQAVVIIGRVISEIYNVSPKVAQNLWELLDRERLAATLSRAGNIEDSVECLGTIQSANPGMSRCLCDLLDLHRLALTLDESEDLANIGKYVAMVHEIDREVGVNLLLLMDKSKLAGKLSHPKQLWDDQSCIVDIGNCDPDFGCIRAIFKVNKKMGLQLWSLVDKTKLASELSKRGSGSIVESYIRDLHGTESDIAEDFCALLDLNRLAKRFGEKEDPSFLGSCISMLLLANPSAARELWRLIDKHCLIGRLFDDVSDGIECISGICAADPIIAEEFCSLLNVHELAAALNETSDTTESDKLLKAIGEVNPEVHKELLKRLSEGKNGA